LQSKSSIRGKRGPEGYVYFLSAPLVGMIKIGFSGSWPGPRMDAIAAASPVPLEPVGYVFTEFASELELHRHFGRHRAHREWFRFDDEIRDWIAEHAWPWVWDETRIKVMRYGPDGIAREVPAGSPRVV
jgi:hypothetical protein